MNFNVGDKVKINNKAISHFSAMCGKLAQIVGVNIDNFDDICRIRLHNGTEFHIYTCFLEHSSVGVGSTVTIDPISGAGFVENSFGNKCKLCKGVGSLLMLNNYVPCDCQTNIGVDQ